MLEGTRSSVEKTWSEFSHETRRRWYVFSTLSAIVSILVLGYVAYNRRQEPIVCPGGDSRMRQLVQNTIPGQPVSEAPGIMQALLQWHQQDGSTTPPQIHLGSLGVATLSLENTTTFNGEVLGEDEENRTDQITTDSWWYQEACIGNEGNVYTLKVHGEQVRHTNAPEPLTSLTVTIENEEETQPVQVRYQTDGAMIDITGLMRGTEAGEGNNEVRVSPHIRNLFTALTPTNQPDSILASIVLDDPFLAERCAPFPCQFLRNQAQKFSQYPGVIETVWKHTGYLPPRKVELSYTWHRQVPSTTEQSTE